MFELNELQVLRSSLNTIDIKGSNAQYLANLQIKLEQEILRIEEAEKKKEEDLKLGPPELRDNKVEQKTIKK
jgi:hypothetical protein|tara:strand:- start:92 stop:307 length:216 start_codon:yes stop_codon:yes gene_type:complete